MDRMLAIPPCAHGPPPAAPTGGTSAARCMGALDWRIPHHIPFMHARTLLVLAATVAITRAAAAQAPAADAFRAELQKSEKNLVGAAEVMPAEKYGFKPTPAQLSFGDVVVHLSQGNDALCGMIGGMKAPERTPVAAKDGKAALV